MSIKQPVTDVVFEAFARGSATVVRLLQRDLKDAAEDMDTESVQDAFQQLAELAEFGLDLADNLNEDPDCCGMKPQCHECPLTSGPQDPSTRDEEEEE